MNIKWISCQRKTTIEELSQTEKILSVCFPNKYKEIVLEFNGASTLQNCWNLPNGEEKVFDRLLSFNKDDKENIYFALETFQEKGTKRLIPFASDPFGNDICFDYSTSNTNPSIVFHDHERAYEDDAYNGEFVCSSFDEFLNMLYEPEE